jgi:hypothetical protein
VPRNIPKLKVIVLRRSTSPAANRPRAVARQLPVPIYGWFTEGFETTDLLEAKALLQDLS